MDWLVDYIGTPYRSKGADSDGVDCYGLIHLIYKEQLGISLPDFSEGYTDANNQAEASKTIENGIPEFDLVTDQKLFDIVILRIMGWPCHCGMYIGDNKMLHALEGHATAIESLNSPKWKTRVEGFYRWTTCQ